jgi:four helix bundle protein
MGEFQDLRVWRKAHELTLDVYRLTMIFPREELYGLTSQLRRSAASVPSNIAEGCGRDADTELKQFLRIALGSANELQYQILLAHDIGYIDTPPFEQLSAATLEVRGMLTNLIRSLQNRRPSTVDRRPSTVDR